eukprot:CAMPEP_0185033656 /NCGR_PEP_ID=MMETSP1103-20130426/22805_1 /TAXON_ID=36769 /ORGANISM="Paraphysomonas bandaiensis, Strain Caron Lab Isolate" /LENGTH=625 /DNA_ID=CAMNT_0027570011 /DNA_START=16 /DNA_END=1893 /DNA_ORIENTATION=-
MTHIKEIAATRAKLAKRKQLEDEAREAERQKQIDKENEERRAREMAAAAAEKAYKTNHYFDFDRQFRKIEPPGCPMYYGDNIKVCGTWTPHGHGELRFEDTVVYSGHYDMGVMHGTGVFVFDDKTVWEGEFKRGKMYGVGHITYPVRNEDGELVRGSDPVEVLMRNNHVVCHKKDLHDGVQVELHDKTLRIGNSDRPKVTILWHIEKWTYRCRCHDEIHPRERNIDFSSLASFKVMRHLPLIYDLAHFSIPMDHEIRYDYWADTYRTKGRPALGFAGGRATGEMKAWHAPYIPAAAKPTSKYDENVFESQEMGIGVSLIEKEREMLVEKKRQQWNAAVAAKRAEEAEERQKLIEEEQARILAEAAEKQQEKARQKREEEEARVARLAEEDKKWDTAGAEMEALRSERQQKTLVAERKPAKTVTSQISLSRKDSIWKLSKTMSQSPIQKKALRTVSRIDSRFKTNRNADIVEQGFETGKLVITSAYVQFNAPEGDDEEDIPLFQSIPAYLGFSMGFSGDDQQRSTSVLPLEDEEQRTYVWEGKDLSAVVIDITAETLDLGSIEVSVYEEVRGRKDVRLGATNFNFDAMKKGIGDEVEHDVRLDERGEDKGQLLVKLKIVDTTIYMD